MKKSSIYPLTLFTVFCLIQQSCTQRNPVPAITNYDYFPFAEIDIATLQNHYNNRTYTITQVVQTYLNRIEAIDKNGPSLNSIISVNPDALTIAAELDRELRDGKKRGPLHGIPVLLKDNIESLDPMPTTAGSRALANSITRRDSYVAQRLREAGAVIIGKTNLSEWANFRGDLSTSGWSGVGALTRNPYILSRNPCGSSSGSGVAVSANLAVLAIGTETNGSIVCPSHANGIVGIKPTLGLVGTRGIIPIAFSLDVVGPMARSVRDAAIVLGTLAIVKEPDSLGVLPPDSGLKDYTAFLKTDGLRGKRIGLFTGPMGQNYKVDSLMMQAVRTMKSMGATIIEINRVMSSNTGKHALEVMLFEYKAGLNNYFRSLGEAAPVKNIAELIAFNKEDSSCLQYFNQIYLEKALEKADLGSKEYLDALTAMRKGARDQGIDMVMSQYRLHAIIAPTGSPAWKTDLINGDSFQLGSSSAPAYAGYPNITVPMGFVEDLPVGISIFGRAWSEPVLLEIAYSYEQATKHRRAPKFLPAD